MPTETAPTRSDGCGQLELARGPGQRHPGARDRRGAGAAVGLEDVAVDPDRSLAESAEVVDRAQRAAEQALDLDGAPFLPPGAGLALRAHAGRGGQHAVLGGQPAAPRPREPARHAVVERRRAEDARAPEGDEHRAVRLLDEVGDSSTGRSSSGRRPSRLISSHSRHDPTPHPALFGARLEVGGGPGWPHLTRQTHYAAARSSSLTATRSTAGMGSWRKRSPRVRNSSGGPVVRKRQPPSRVGVVLDSLARERLRYLARRLLRGEDERRLAPEDPLEDAADERVVRAAEDDRIHPSLPSAARRTRERPRRERDSSRRPRSAARAAGRRRDHFSARVERANCRGVAAALDGRLGGEHPDAPVARRLHGGVRLRSEHADDGTSRLSCSSGSAAAVAELHAATMSFTPLRARYDAISWAKRRISSRGRGP